MDNGEGGGFFAALFLFIVYGLSKIFKRQKKQVFNKDKTKKGTGKPFFIKSLTRRRRLNLCRKRDNILSGGMGEKLRRHREGMFGKWRKK